VAKFDQYWKYENGLEVSVLSAKASGPNVTITVRLKNKTGTTYDAEFTQVTLTYGPDGEQAENTYRYNGEYPFQGTIANGRSKTVEEEFAVPKNHQDDLVIEITPDESEPALFAGKAS